MSDLFIAEATAPEIYFPFKDCFSSLMLSISVFQHFSFLPKADLFHHHVFTQMAAFL